MDAKEQLRRYLEQRREMGERELVLDGMTVSDVLRLIGASSASAPAPAADDWRAAIRSAGGEPDAKPGAARSAPTAAQPSAAPEVVSEPSVLRGPERSPPTDDEMFGGDEAPPRLLPAPVRDDARLEPALPRGASAPGAAPIGAPAVTGIVIGSTERSLFGGPAETYASLDEVAVAVHSCTRCALYETATHGVPGEGSARAELVCVGEAPGAVEDETGRPFVGEAGKLLTKILAAINLRREDVYICNVLKHRPPGNRNPLPNEIAACSPYLIHQLELIRPKAILALGTFAAQTLLNTKTPIGKLRGAVHRYHGIPLVVTYHPAALLRNPSWKRPTWEDVQLARRILDSSAGA
jgi:uracil-DNA glycosylase